MAGETTPSGSTSNSVQPNAPSSTEQVASQSIRSNTDRLGQVDVQGLVNSVKASSPDVQAQRDVAAAAAKQIDDRGVRREFVKALEDQGVARKPGFWERQWQGIKGTATGVYEGGASLVGGVYDLGKMGVQGTVASAKFGYNYATDGQYRADTNAAVGRAADATLDATKEGLSAAKDYAADRIADPSKLLDDAKAVDAAVRSGADAVAKKADQLYDSYDKARSEAVIQGTTDELGGKIVGRAAFEIGTAVVPVSKLGIVGKGAAAAADAGKVIQGADAAADATRVVRGVDVATDAGKAVKASDEVVDAANRALVRGGDDPARVARVEQEARATAPMAGSAAAGGRTVASGGVRSSDGVRGLSELGGVFSPSVNQAGGRVWTSVGDISQNDFAGIVNSELMQGRNVNIISGVHGKVDGTIAAVDHQMYLDDVARFGEIPGVSVHNYPSMAPGQVRALLESPDATIGGFCNSTACLAAHGRGTK